MRLMLHILKKDTRRLSWQVIVTLVLLAALARADSQRADYIPGSMEGWLNLLLPAAWGFLVALLIQEEPPVGDRQFWITRPYRWNELLAAKSMFAALLIHLPYFLADCAILVARGFRPFDYIPLLLWKQFYLAGALTIPAAALAAVVKNLAQFMLSAVVVTGGAVLLMGWVEPFSAPWISVDEVRRGLALLVLAAAAVAIVLLQYARRRTALSRTLGVAALLIAGILFASLPRKYTFALESAAHEGSVRPSIHLAARHEDPPPQLRRIFPAGPVTIALPFTLSGIPEGSQVRLQQLGIEIVGPVGDRYGTVVRPGSARPARNRIEAIIWKDGWSPVWQILRVDRAIYDRIKDGRVKLAGKVGATFYREGEAVWMPVGGNAQPPALGRCFSVLIEDPRREEMLKVVCESPSEIPLPTWVRLVEGAGGREWKKKLGDSTLNLSYPARTWLSPLNRRQTFFHLTNMPDPREGSRWVVPRDALTTAKIVVIPEHITGATVVDYEIADLALSDFVVQPDR